MSSYIERLFKSVKDGNDHKKEELLMKLKPLIIKSIRRYCNKFSQYEDLIQQGYEVILKGIDSFDEKRDVIFYYYIKNKSIREISDILKISYRTVINTKTTALKKLKKQL